MSSPQPGPAPNPDPVGPEPSRSGLPPATIEEVMARFIVWLARRDVPVHRGRRYHSHVERYLRWRTPGADPGAEDTQRGYYHLLRRHCIGADELAVARTSLGLFASYLRTAPARYPSR